MNEKIKFRLAKTFEGESVSDLIYCLRDFCHKLKTMEWENIEEYVGSDDIGSDFKLKANDIDEQSLNEEIESLSRDPSIGDIEYHLQLLKSHWS